MALDGYTVNGPALVYVGTGLAGALELLGYTTDGVEMNIVENKSEIITDVLGPMTPQDFQDMGMVATFQCPFVSIDRSILAKVMGRGNRTTLGLLNAPGLVLGAGGYLFRLAIASSFDPGGPWSFYAALLQNTGTKLATKVNPLNQRFLAFPYLSYTATSGLNAPLWQRTLS